MKSQPPALPLHIASIDILRALTMLLMIFVNDLWSLKGIPDWLEHTKANEDGMGLADTVFPAFLFIVGMSIPFSVQSRRARGEQTASICWHIISRALALLVMGLFLVNGEYLNAAATGFSADIWNCLCCASFILIWNAYPKTMNPWIKRFLKFIGVVILLLLASLCRGGEDGKINGFQTYWYGILGIIGWAYLVSALIYVYAEKYFAFLVLIWAALIMLCSALHSGWIANSFLRNVLSFASVSGHAALVMGGVLTSMILRNYAKQGKQRQLIIVLFVIAIAILSSGFFVRKYFIISKILATPSWILICSAITIFMFILLHWLVDMKNKEKWFAIIKPAGTNTLVCYLLPYFAYALVVFLHLSLPLVLLTGGIGLVKSFLFSLLIVVIAGILGKWGVRVRL